MFDMKILIIHTYIENILGKCIYLHSSYFVLQLLSKIFSQDKLSIISYLNVSNLTFNKLTYPSYINIKSFLLVFFVILFYLYSCVSYLQPVLSGDIASDLPGLRHDQRLRCDSVVWMVSLLQGVLWPQRAQGAAHTHQKSEPVPNWWRGRLSRARGERALHSPGRRSATLHCVSTGQR